MEDRILKYEFGNILQVEPTNSEHSIIMNAKTVHSIMSDFVNAGIWYLFC